MNHCELESWLCGPHECVPSPAEIAGVLGLALPSIADTTLLRTSERLHALRFTIAVLRDVFPDDGEVRSWLQARRAQLNGRRALDLLLAGRMAVVEELAVHEWHGQLAPLVAEPPEPEAVPHETPALTD